MSRKDLITPIEQHAIDFVLALRNKFELTQDDIANIIGISRSYIKDIESTNRIAKYNLIHINALADYFNISPREFLPEKAFPVEKGKTDVKKSHAKTIKKTTKGESKTIKKNKAAKK